MNSVRAVFVSVLFAIFTLPIPCFAENPQSNDPFTFNVEKIPFGKSDKEVLQMVTGAEVKEEEEARFSTVANYYGFEEKYFKRGIYYRTIVPNRKFLHPGITKKYTVKYGASSNIYRLSLYFVGTTEKGYNLVLVDKELKSISGDFPGDVKNIVDSVSKKLGRKHTTERFVYKDIDPGGFSDTYPALLNVWSGNNIKTILLSRPGLFGSNIETSIVSVSNIWWKKYLDLSEKVEAIKRREEVKQIQKNVDDI